MLVQESGLACVQRLIRETKSVSDGEITVDDMKSAMRKIKPSAMREITFDIPKVSWEQIGGQHDLKKKLQQAIVWPIKHAESFKRLNIRPPRGILMYGPPGCSKTMIGININQTNIKKIIIVNLKVYILKQRLWQLRPD